MLRKLFIPIAVILFVLAVFLRFYNLGSIPLGLNKDESAIGYNAYSILQTGRDEHGVKMPLYFKSFNDYKLPGYIYLTAGSEKLFGVTPFAVRLPSAVFGLFAIIALFFLVKILTKRLDLAIISALFLAFNPWHFFFSRTGFEVNVATSFAVLGSLFFVLSVQKKGNIFLILLSILSFGSSVYTYNVTRILAPLLFGTLLFLYHKQIRAWPRSTQIIGLLVSVGVLLPLAMTLLNSSGLGNQTAGVFLNGAATAAENTELRSQLIYLPDIFTKLFFNSSLLMLWDYGINLIKSFSTDFFFTMAPKTVNGIAHHGVFYPFELITIGVGIFMAIKSREKTLRYFLLWLGLAILLVSLTQEVPHPTRSFMQVIPLTVFSAYGALYLWKYPKTSTSQPFRSVLSVGMLFIGGYALLTYCISYFFYFPSNQAKLWHAADAELIQFLAQNEKNYDKIVIDSRTDFPYTSLVFYEKYPPAAFQKTVKYKSDGLLITAAKLGKYEFKDINWDEYNSSERSLYITTKEGFENKPIYKTFSYPERTIVQAQDQTITTFPFKDPAYVLIESRKKIIK